MIGLWVTSKKSICLWSGKGWLRWLSAPPDHITREPKVLRNVELLRTIPHQKLQYIWMLLLRFNGFQQLVFEWSLRSYDVQTISWPKQWCISGLTQISQEWVVWDAESRYGVSFSSRHSVFPNPDWQRLLSAPPDHITREPKVLRNVELLRTIPHQKLQYIWMLLLRFNGFQQLVFEWSLRSYDVQTISWPKQWCISGLTQISQEWVVWDAESRYGVSFSSRHSVFPNPDRQR